MTIPNHYREAEGTLKKAQQGSRPSAAALATAQLHALLVIADELRDVHNELTEIRRMLARSA